MSQSWAVTSNLKISRRSSSERVDEGMVVERATPRCRSS
jgi:hypothetical protein